MNQTIPKNLGIGHKVKTSLGKGKIINKKGEIAKILVGGEIIEEEIGSLKHVKDTSSNIIDVIDERYIEENCAKLIDEHLKRLDEININDYLELFQRFFAIIIKGLNFTHYKEFNDQYFRANLAQSLEEKIAMKLNDDNFKIGSYAKLPAEVYENPETSLKRILGQFLKQMVNAESNGEYDARSRMQQTLRTGDEYCKRFLDKFKIVHDKN